MKKTYLSFLMVILCLQVSVVNAGGYVGVNYGLLDYSEQGISEEFSVTALGIRVGNQIGEAGGIEARFGFGLDDDSQTIRVSGVEVDTSVELDTYFSVYGKVGKKTGPYLLLGFTSADLTADASVESSSASVSGSESGISFGIGATIGSGDTGGFTIEWLQLLDEDGFEVSGINFGFVSYF